MSQRTLWKVLALCVVLGPAAACQRSDGDDAPATKLAPVPREQVARHEPPEPRQVQRLKAEGRSLTKSHRKVYRPWGWYDSIDAGERFQVKRIVVSPGASLSLQLHRHRAEHWVVVNGVAEVTCGDTIIRLKENESTFVPVNTPHRLSNPGTEPLEIIEVQSGDYLGEDDIVRLEDDYGRTEP